MKKSLYILLGLICWSVSLQATAPIVPMPRKCVEKKGYFTVNEKTVIALPEESDSLLNAVSVWNDLFATAAGFSLKISTSAPANNVIRCRLTDRVTHAEGYKLKVSRSAIHIDARTSRGIFYAFQTLRQLLPSAIESSGRVEMNTPWNIPCVEIEDEPEFGYRGVMLDVSRHFIPKEDIKRHIDLLAFHKLNTLHWHLTDDQGWRIEIKKYPKLTSVGGFRKKTIRGYMWDNPTEWDTERYGGFYTQEDVREIVAYARKRFVEIIPEIEMPGHALAALAAYPEYACSGGPFEVEGRWGVFNDIFCTKEETFTFIQHILDEVAGLFPSAYIHLGGDEAPRIRWKNCVHCQTRMREEGLKTEAELQTYFINRIEHYLNGKGKKIIGWDEILEGGIPRRATVMSWRGEKGGIQAAQAGYDVIMSPNIYMYFNCFQSKDNGGWPGNPKRIISLEKVYRYHPVPETLTPDEATHIKGVQANLWTEYICTRAEMEYMLYPRVAALAETGWSSPETKDYAGFLKRLDSVKTRYGIMGVNYHTEKAATAWKAAPIDIHLEQKGESVFASGFPVFSLDGHFVWCGSAIRAEEDGRYYLFYSAMESGKNHPPFGDAWVLGSKIGVAVSDSPYGNYQQIGFVYNKDGYRPDSSAWDAQTVSNTHIKRFNGKYYLYYCGSSDPGSDACIRGKLSRRNRIQQNQKLGVICFNTIQDLLEGRFTCNEQPLLTPRTRVKADNVLNPSPAGTPVRPDNLIMVNPSVVYQPFEKKYYLYFKGNVYDPTWRGVHGVAIADNPEGPFTVQDDYVFEFDTGDNQQKLNAEDPFVWYHRKDRCFYAVFKDFTGAFTKGKPGLALMYSVDGLHWKLPEHSLFMDKAITLKDGTRINVDRLERPQLLLDENDNPIALYAACAITPVNPKQDGSSFNIQIPVIAE